MGDFKWGGVLRWIKVSGLGRSRVAGLGWRLRFAIVGTVRDVGRGELRNIGLACVALGFARKASGLSGKAPGLARKVFCFARRPVWLGVHGGKARVWSSTLCA